MKKAKKSSRPVYFVIRRLVDPATGEEVGALVPRHQIDVRLMRERAYRVGDDLRADLKKPRNARFHRMVHVLGGILADHVEAFTGMDCHSVIKRLQRETGICCEEQDVDIPGIGKLVIKVAMSLSFDEMEEGEFYQLWQGICRYVSEKYWPDLSEEQISDMADLMPSAA